MKCQKLRSIQQQLLENCPRYLGSVHVWLWPPTCPSPHLPSHASHTGLPSSHTGLPSSHKPQPVVSKIGVNLANHVVPWPEVRAGIRGKVSPPLAGAMGPHQGEGGGLALHPTSSPLHLPSTSSNLLPSTSSTSPASSSSFGTSPPPPTSVCREQSLEENIAALQDQVPSTLHSTSEQLLSDL